MQQDWCPICGTQHFQGRRCPGDVPSTGPEHPGWRVNVETPHGVEAYGVLLSESHDAWRARIVTYPNVLWVVPGGKTTLKFVARSERDAERQAISFIRHHCHLRGLGMRDELQPVESVSRGGPPLAAASRLVPQVFSSRPVASSPTRAETRPSAGGTLIPSPPGPPAARHIRFLPVRFGVVGPSERGGTGNLSSTGMFIITNSPVSIESQVRLLLNVTVASTIELNGIVRWNRDQHHVGRSPGMGVQIVAPPQGYLTYVRSLS